MSRPSPRRVEQHATDRAASAARLPRATSSRMRRSCMSASSEYRRWPPWLRSVVGSP